MDITRNRSAVFTIAAPASYRSPSPSHHHVLAIEAAHVRLAPGRAQVDGPVGRYQRTMKCRLQHGRARAQHDDHEPAAVSSCVQDRASYGHRALYVDDHRRRLGLRQ